MKNNYFTILSAGLLLSSGVLSAATTASSHLERGVELMQDEATLEDAILHFEKVLLKQDESRKLAAEAYFLLAKCQIQLGNVERARVTVAKLKADWPADNKWVKQSARLVPRPSVFRSVPWKDGEFSTYQVEITEEGEKIDAGSILSALVSSEHDGVKVWTVWGISSSSESEFSKIEFDAVDLRPLEGRVVSSQGGDVSIKARADGGLDLRQDSAKLTSFPEAKPWPGESDPATLYHHHQMFELVRVLPEEIGTTVTLPITRPEPRRLPIEVEVSAVKHESVTVPAGTFDCVLFTTDRDESIWVERTGSRRVIRLEMGPMVIILTSTDSGWNPNKPMTWGPDTVGLEFDVPEGIITCGSAGGLPYHADNLGERIGIFDTKLRVWGGAVEQIPMGHDAPSASQLKELMPKAGTDDDLSSPSNPGGAQTHPLVGRLVQLMTLSGDEVSENELARKLTTDGERTTFHTRLKVKRLDLEFERTVFFSFEDQTMTVLHFDHAPRAGTEASELLNTILGGL
jgi:hypothetical protein